MKSIKKLYLKLRLQTKITITHLVIATLPMIVIAIFLFSSLNDMILSNTILKEQKASTKTAPLIEEIVNEILDVHDDVQSLDFYQSLTSFGRTSTLGNLGRSSEAILFQDNINRFINSSAATAVKIYLDAPIADDIFTVSAIPEIIEPIDAARGTYWHGIFSGNTTLRELQCPSFYLSRQEVEDYGSMAYITKNYILYDGQYRPCYLVIYYSGELLNELLLENLASDENVAYVINSRDNLIATSNAAMSGTYHFNYAEVQKYFMSSNNFIEKNVLGEDVYAGFYSIENTDWYMVTALPARPIIARSNNIILGLVCIYILCILIALAIATILSHSITNRLAVVIHQMGKTRIAPPVALPEPDFQDEVGDLVESYNYMTRVINRLMEEQSAAAEELRIAEFNSLQAQINPHFLYNTMEMINWLSQQNRSSEVTEAIQKLSRFYKLTLSRKKTLSTIEDEIEHVSIYVQLQNMRFHNDIDFIIDIPDNLLEYSIPKLTFQPVIENCILHGILEKECKKGTIVLTGWLEDETVVILISDNGVGIPEERLKVILSGNAASNKKGGSNIAVYNTHKRLQILYGKAYGLRYASTVGMGTDVEIRLPAILPEES